MGFLDDNGVLYFGQRIKLYITGVVSGLVPTTRKVNNKALSGDITIDADDVGLGDVKERLGELELGEYIPLSSLGAANGAAETDGNNKLLLKHMPGGVATFEVVDNYASLPPVGDPTVTYITEDTGESWKWNGSSYTKITDPVVLGETSSTAHRGDHGKIAYEHSQLKTGNPHDVTKTEVGLGNVLNAKQATDSDVGDVSGLETEAGTVVGAINELFNSAPEITAITNSEIDALFPVT